MGIGLRALVLAASITASPAFAADQQFDLICTAPTSRAHYRIDLAKGEACEGECDRVWKIPAITTGELILTNRSPAFRGDVEERATVNRASGAWHYYLLFDGRPSAHDGKCEVAAFSGFPKPKF